MIKEKLLKKENRIVILTIVLLGLFIIIGTSFALWSLTFRQTSTNQINTSCFKIDFIEKDDINLQDAYPLTDEEAKNLSPYNFTITNICDTSATYQVNLEELELEEKKLSNQYINLSLNEKTGRLSTLEEVTKTLDNATTSHKLTTGVLKSKEEKSFELRLWLRDDTPSTSDVMNAIFLSKITIITVYKKNIPELSATAYENQDTIKVDVNSISNPDNETLNYYYQLDNNEEIKSSTPNYTFPNLQDGTYKVKVRVEDANGIVIFEKEEDVVVAYEHVYVSSTGSDTTGNGSPDLPYANLQRAYNKVKSGGEMILLSDITATSTTNMNTANKEVTLMSNGDKVYSIIRGTNFKSSMLIIENSNTLTTTNITLDGNNINANGSLIEARDSTLNLNNRTLIQNNINLGKYSPDWKLNGALGGGVYMYNGTINITDATITHNTVNYTADSVHAQGGGIAIYFGTLNLNSGEISHNISTIYGGGISAVPATINMNGGSIINNSAKQGSGIHLSNYNTEGCTMTMIGGIIEGNTATSIAGGISVSSSSSSIPLIVYLRGGSIRNNTAPTAPNTYASNGAQIIDQR